MIALQENYKQKMKQQSNDHEEKVDSLNEKISQLELELEKWKNEQKVKPEVEVTSSITTSKSDDGWCLNGNYTLNWSIYLNQNNLFYIRLNKKGEEIKDIDLESKISHVDYESLIKEKDNEIQQLKLQVRET